MKQLKFVKRGYSCLAIIFIILGGILLIWPKTTLEFICKIIGIVFLICGILKILGYFSKDVFQLAFQFDLGLGIVTIIVGLVMIFRTGHLVEVVSASIGIFILVDAALKIQTAVDAKRFGIERWWIILIISLVVTVVGILLIVMPWKTTELVTRLIGINLCFDGFLNLWVVQKTVKIIRRFEE
ncbi:MAG: DUF308 domain-containing protein [Clostridiales bacterium]|nr:DUF308 domain-containing protein [Clostridiales bacterium]